MLNADCRLLYTPTVNRDLVFFLAGLSFGIVAGYFVFRAVVPATGPSAVASAPATSESSIGLDDEPQLKPLDEGQVAALRAQAEENPEDAAVRARLGSLYLEAGRYEEAVAWLRTAVELAPQDLHARNHLALAHLNAGNLDEAVATYEQTLRYEPNHPPSLLGLGRVKLYLQQDIDGGLAMWEHLVAVAPDSAEAQSVRDELEALKSAHSRS